MLSVLSLDILSAIMFSMVLIHLALAPTFGPIRRPQKNLARALPIINFLFVCRVQFSALMLSLTHRTTGCGSLFFFLVANMTIKAQQSSMIVTYSRQLMEMNLSSELSLRCKSILSTTSFGNKRCYQKFRVVEQPPHATRELSPKIDAVGILGVKCEIGVSNLIFESDEGAWEMKFSTSHIVELTRQLCLCLLTIFAAFFIAKLM